MPNAGREILGGPRHHRDIEDWLVTAVFQLAEDEDVVVLVDEVLARHSAPGNIRSVCN
jgi:hypothetical protein